ncbi:MAG: hypothetical protein RIS64_4348, partial [Bacteroidota bacterium]
MSIVATQPAIVFQRENLTDDILLELYLKLLYPRLI